MIHAGRLGRRHADLSGCPLLRWWLVMGRSVTAPLGCCPGIGTTAPLRRLTGGGRLGPSGTSRRSL